MWLNAPHMRQGLLKPGADIRGHPLSALSGKVQSRCRSEDL
ncbi:protein of unknown function [Candidatus Nitrospira inopinata]|uniref:Uncharacterized protein n=1 Tax=Candidatus Nitrospira inopinata TaxID=1715989 RepID=A0A0S4KVG3_9BACT|nr:protein of unknown function [Candidatus Nitrospira inopinata]